MSFPPPLEELKEVLRNVADWINVSTDNQKSRANMLRVAEVYIITIIYPTTRSHLFCIGSRPAGGVPSRDH